ncbi:Exonuclease mut-7 [Haplosporangium sp. Z 27]|nr:Exonuclease mut-7 [Haplosporangium sp. Z 27]
MTSRSFRFSSHNTESKKAQRAANANFRSKPQKHRIRLIVANNAFEIASILLKSCQDFESFQLETELGNANNVKHTIENGILHHIQDPALFTIHILISVGVISESRSLDRRLEKAVSKLLSDPFRHFLSSRQYANKGQETTDNTSRSHEQHNNQRMMSKDNKSVSLDIAGTRGGEQDLIIWDDTDSTIGSISEPEIKRDTRTSMDRCTLRSTGDIPQSRGRHSKSNFNLLDDDEDSSISGSVCLMPLQPMVPSRISPYLPSMSEDEKVATQGWDTAASSPRSEISTSAQKGLYSSTINHSSQALRTADRPRHRYSHEAEGAQIEVKYTNTSLPYAQDPRLSSPPLQDDQTNNVSENTKVIEPRHQTLLLNEIAAEKSVLQVCALLDVFDMRQYLSDDIQQTEHGFKGTYGSYLVQQLLEIDELKEAVVLVTRFFTMRDRDLDLEILARLLILGDLALIHDFIGEIQEICIVALQYIDTRFSTLLARWCHAGYFEQPYSSSSFEQLPIPTSVTLSTEQIDQMLEAEPKIRVKLVEIATSLIMRFSLEDSIKQSNSMFPNIASLVQYYTAITLLNGISVVETPKTNFREVKQTTGKEVYATLQSPWMILPFVIDLIRGDRRVQSMIIRHCVFEKRDRSTASFLAAKLDLGSMYQKWVFEDDTVSGYAKTEISHQPLKQEATKDTEVSRASPTVTHSDTFVSSRRSTPSLSMDPDDITARLWSSTVENPSYPNPKPPTNIPHVSRTARSAPSNQYYSPPLDIKAVIIDHVNQLDQLLDSLFRSRIIGLSSEWLPRQDQINSRPKGQNLDASRGASERGGGSSNRKQSPKTALLQLACDHEDCVYLVDAAKFGENPCEKLGIILGEMFSNPSIQKIAYNWSHDKRLLEGTFPILSQKQYSLKNFIDLRFIWLKLRNAHTLVTSTNSVGNTTSNGDDVGWLEAWSTVPQGQSMSRSDEGGLSNMVQRFCGKALDKTEQNSDWEHRPLTKGQLQYSVASVRCLLDIHAILERTQRIV